MSNAAGALPDIRQTVTIRKPIQKVWNAVSTAEGVAAWFMPNNLEPKVGFEFQIDGGPWGKSKCKVTVVEPPYKLSFTWGKDWTLTFELVDRGDETEFTLIHSGWSVGGATEFGQPHEVVRETMNGGWAGIVKKLATTLEA